VVDVPAGHALYLPAGWFHDVTSFNAPGPLRRNPKP
jgi:hypothetical protein